MVEVTRSCFIDNTEEKKSRLRDFLKEYGDDLPEESIIESTEGEALDNWEVECDANGEIIGAVTFIDNDWYLCTFHYLAVHPSYRRRGIGKELTERLLEKMKNTITCKVMAADITHDNIGSLKIFEKLGFKPVSKFCWMKGQKPAYVVHYIRDPPDDENRCT